jgi:hypothetical protein
MPEPGVTKFTGVCARPPTSYAPPPNIRPGGPGKNQPTEVGQGKVGTMPSLAVKRLGSPEPPQASSSYSGSGSIEADIAPFERASRRSAPKAWIWSRFSSACSLVVVSTITRPSTSTSFASR